MAKGLGKIGRALSALLAAAMIITALPQTGIAVYAAETENVPEEDITLEEEPQDGTVEDQNDPDTPAADEEDDLKDPVTDGEDDPEDPDATETDQGEQGDEADADAEDDPPVSEDINPGEEIEDPLEDQISSELEGRPAQALFSEGQETEQETKTVRINLPYYNTGYTGGRPALEIGLLEELWYKTGTDTEFQQASLPESGSYSGFYVEIPVPAGDTLAFRFTLKKHAKLKDIRYSCGDEKKELQDTEGIYTIDTAGTEGSDHVITIDAVHTYSVTFVDVYADEHNGTRSLKVMKNDPAGQGKAQDVIGKTIDIEESEIIFEGKKNNAYIWSVDVEPEAGFTFQRIQSNTTSLSFQINKADKARKKYDCSIRRVSGLPEEITVFVFADETQTHRLTLNMSDEMQGKMVDVAVYAGKPGETASDRVTPQEDGSYAVTDDVSVSFSVAAPAGDLAHLVQAKYHEDGSSVSRDNIYMYNDTASETAGWSCKYYLGKLDQDMTVDLSFSEVYRIGLRVDWETVETVSILSPLPKTYTKENAAEDLFAYAPAGEELKFDFDIVEGKGVNFASTTGDADGEITSVYDEENLDYQYAVTAKQGLTVYMGTKPYEYTFDYTSAEGSLRVYDNRTGERLTLSESNRCSSDSDDMSFRVLVKPAAGKTVSLYYYDWNMEETDYLERDSQYDEDGYLAYVLNSTKYVEGRTIHIEEYVAYKIAFAGSSVDAVTLEECVKDEWDDYSWAKISPDRDITVRAGNVFRFRITGYDRDTHKLVVGMTGMPSDSLHKAWEEDEMEETDVYWFTPDADVTISIAVTEKEQYTLTVDKGETIAGFTLEIDWTEQTLDWTEQTSSTRQFTVTEGTYVSIRNISFTDGNAGAVGKVTRTVGDETVETILLNSYTEDSFLITGDTQVHVTAEQKTQHNLTVTGAENLKDIRVWALDAPTVNLYGDADGSTVLANDKEYGIDFQAQDGWMVQSVTMNGGSIRKIGEMNESSDPGYYIGTPLGDITIAVKLVPAYTVRFDTSQATDVRIYKIFNSYDWDYQEEIGEKGYASVAADESFFYPDQEDRYKFSIDSDLFTLKRIRQEDQWDNAYYGYVITPGRTENLPKSVTVSVVKYDEHRVTLEYPAQVRSISLTNGSTGYNFKLTNKTAVVYGTEIMLAVGTIAGYAAKVRLQGDSGEQELTPYRNEEDRDVYYLGELTEDKTISVTVERASQQQKSNDVTFYSEGGKVTVRDTVYNTPYDIAADGEDCTTYQIPEGDQVSFYVEPDQYYEVDAVYANGTKVEPVYDETRQRDIYTVTPTEYTLIRIDVSYIAPKYAITFVYPDTVSSVTVKDYVLQNNMLQVKAGTKLSFKVELSDPKYVVDSVKMNGSDVPYNKSSGYYMLTTLEKAMTVEITTGLVPGPDPGPDVPDGLWIKAIPDVTYSGAAHKPVVEVYDGKTLLTEKKDYTVAYGRNIDAGPGQGKITVKGKGNYASNAKATFNILKKDIDDADIVINDVCAVIKNNGTVSNPKVVVKFGNKALKENSDYKVEWPKDSEIKDSTGKVKAGEYRVTISTAAVKKQNGVDVDSKNYTGSRTIKYTIRGNGTLLMSGAKITLEDTKVNYAGEMGADTAKPAIKSIKVGKKYVYDTDRPERAEFKNLTEFNEAFDVDYGENWNKVGKAVVTVTAKAGNTKCFGSKSVTYTVNGTKLAAKELKIEGIEKNYAYTGAPIYVSKNGADGGTLKVTRIKDGKKTIEVLLEEGKDYEVSYKTGKKPGEHTNAGKVTVTITGINAYTGSVAKTFTITRIDLATFGTANAPAELAFTADKTAKYTKAGAKPKITQLTFNGKALVEKQDYTVSYAKNMAVKEDQESATMTIKGKGNFTGQLKHKYKVTIASEADVSAEAADIAKPATFKQLKSAVKVKVCDATGKALKAGTDYEKAVKYYSDEACTQEITETNFNKPAAEGSNETRTDVDKEIYVKIVMKGNYAGTTGTPGSVTAKFRVYDKNLAMTSNKIKIKVDTTVAKDGSPIAHDDSKNLNPYYTGKKIEPKVTVALKGSGGADLELTEGKDYKVVYSNQTYKGKATVTVTGIGNGYGGSKSLKFTIVPANMSLAQKAGEAAQKALEIFSELIPQN